MHNVIVNHDGIEHETEKALLILVGKDKHWIPKSQIKDEDATWVEIPEWLAIEKELV